jgi:hypothetical protein
MTEKYYIVKSDEGYWSNKNGWVDKKKYASIFTQEERKTGLLPIGNNVRWQYYPACNFVFQNRYNINRKGFQDRMKDVYEGLQA